MPFSTSTIGQLLPDKTSEKQSSERPLWFGTRLKGNSLCWAKAVVAMRRALGRCSLQSGRNRSIKSAAIHS